MRLIYIAHNIRSLYNIGSIFRTADGLGLKKLYLTGFSANPQSHPEQLAKTALGAEKTVPWEKQLRLKPLINKLKKDGWQIIALEEKRGMSRDFRDWRPKGKIAVILGNEKTGIPKSILLACDRVISLPMNGSKNSLNVGVAAGAIGYYCLACGQ